MIRQTDQNKHFFSPKRPILEFTTKAMMELSCLLKLHIFPLTEEAIFTIKKNEALLLEGGESHTSLQGVVSSQSDSQNTKKEADAIL